MTTTVDTKNLSNTGASSAESTVEALAIATKALSFKDKERLLDLIEQQIFEEEQDNCEETEESIAAVASAKAEFAVGDCMEFDEFLASRSEQTL